MRKIISIILVIALAASLAIPAFAEETEAPQYGKIKVEYSDSRGSIEDLEVMILDGYVYANVDSFSSRLGYEWEQNENVVSIYSTASLWGEQIPALALHFRIGDTAVSYNPMCGIEVEYTTPAPCVLNEQGIWVPFSYTLYLLGGSRNIAGDVVTVQMPAQNVLSIAAMITNNESTLSFDWVDDFGYSEQITNVTDGAARVVTLFKGLLAFDGSAWSSFVDWNAFDKKFGKTLAALMCTYSSDELKDSIEEVEVMLDVFDPDGALGSMLRTQETLIDSDVNAWEKICKEKLAQLKAGCGTLPQYNMAYQQYERATKKQDLFSAVGADEIIYIQDGLAEATNALEWAKRIGYGVTYLAEFQQRDDFQASVLKNYFATRKDTDKLDDAAAKAIADYASSDIIEYTLSKFFENHALEILVDKSGLDALMGAPANLLLLAWDIMSETIPFYSEGLESVEAIEISNYAQQVQNDAAQNINALIASLRADSASLSPEDCVQLAEYCYVYLKSCYIARSFAIDSLENISEEARRILKSEIDVETEINQKIAEYLSVLSRADSTNSCYILGFLPRNNEELVAMYTDASIVDIVILDSQNQTPQLPNFFDSGEEKKLLRIDKHSSNGNVETEVLFKYDNSGFLSSITECGYEGTEIILTFTFDEAGKLLNCDSNDYFYPALSCTYDEMGRLVSSYCLGQTKYEYDENGRLIREYEESTIGPVLTERIYTYGTNGLLHRAEEIQRSSSNSEEVMYTTEYAYTHDELGRVATISDGELVTQYYYYKPFVVSVCGNSCELHMNDANGTAVYSRYMGKSEFILDDDGYLSEVVVCGTTSNEAVTYVFVYDEAVNSEKGSSETSENKNGTEVQEWKHAYTEYVEKLLKEMGITENNRFERDMYKYYLAYVDEDEIPELFTINSYGWCYMASFYDGQLYEHRFGADGISFLERKGIIIVSGGRQGVYHDNVCCWENGVLSVLESGDRVATVNSDGSPNYEKFEYEWNGEAVSAQEYEQLLVEKADPAERKSLYSDCLQYTYDAIMDKLS